RDAQETRDYVELPPDFSLEMLAVPEALVGKTLAEAQLPKTWGVRVIEIRWRSSALRQPSSAWRKGRRRSRWRRCHERGTASSRRSARRSPARPRPPPDPPRPLRRLPPPPPPRLAPERLRPLRQGGGRRALPALPGPAGAGVRGVREGGGVARVSHRAGARFRLAAGAVGNRAPEVRDRLARPRDRDPDLCDRA